MVRHGLNIVRKATKDGPRWYVYAWRGGPCIHRQDGVKPIITRDLLIAADAARNEVYGIDNTLDGLISEYEASPEYTRLRDATKRDYRLWLTRISQRFGKAPLAAFEDRQMRGDILAWRDLWSDQPRTADKAAVMLATLLAWGLDRGKLAINVAAGIKTLHRVDKSDQIWEARHWKAVEAQKDFPAHVMRALRLASLTGLRLGDLVRLDWSQVGERAVIVGKTRKRGARAVIPVLPELRTLLDSIKGDKGPVLLNSRGGAWTESGLETVWQRRKPEGFDRTIHDLRGTFATRLIMAGFTDDQAAMVMGWTAKRVASIRARYVNEERVIIELTERLKA
ncbi:MAG: tyrosine-type recombinase/integrase [Novosphingobium sp.]|nr:tyrosine-type recombinase/integrase [Novosphingobium sp.]